MLKDGSSCTRVTPREYLRTKESLDGKSGDDHGSCVLGERMWASDKALRAEDTPRLRKILGRKEDSQGQCDDLWLEGSMRPRGLREARSSGRAISEDAMFNSSIHGCNGSYDPLAAATRLWGSGGKDGAHGIKAYLAWLRAIHPGSLTGGAKALINGKTALSEPRKCLSASGLAPFTPHVRFPQILAHAISQSVPELLQVVACSA
jgi:hypothetical protein